MHRLFRLDSVVAASLFAAALFTAPRDAKADPITYILRETTIFGVVVGSGTLTVDGPIAAQGVSSFTSSTGGVGGGGQPCTYDCVTNAGSGGSGSGGASFPGGLDDLTFDLTYGSTPLHFDLTDTTVVAGVTFTNGVLTEIDFLGDSGAYNLATGHFTQTTSSYYALKHNGNQISEGTIAGRLSSTPPPRRLPPRRSPPACCCSGPVSWGLPEPAAVA